MPSSQFSDAPARGGGVVVGDAVISPPCRGFHCNTAGSVTVRLAGATTDLTFACSAGVTYPYMVAIFRASGLTGTYNYLY